MNKKKLMLCICATLLCLNIFPTNAFAVSWGCDAGKGENTTGGSKNPDNGNNTNSTSTSTNSGSKRPGGGSSGYNPVGTPDNPMRIYDYSHYDSDMNDAFSNFAWEGTNGSKATYRERVRPYNEYSDDDGTCVREYIPTIKFEKWWDYHNVEVSRVTDYYTWNCSGTESWNVRDGQ